MKSVLATVAHVYMVTCPSKRAHTLIVVSYWHNENVSKLNAYPGKSFPELMEQIVEWELWIHAAGSQLRRYCCSPQVIVNAHNKDLCIPCVLFTSCSSDE
jgi:hypothetical protein